LAISETNSYVKLEAEDMIFLNLPRVLIELPFRNWHSTSAQWPKLLGPRPVHPNGQSGPAFTPAFEFKFFCLIYFASHCAVRVNLSYQTGYEIETGRVSVFFVQEGNAFKINIQPDERKTFFIWINVITLTFGARSGATFQAVCHG
jgi:hypothetical protein